MDYIKIFLFLSLKCFPKSNLLFNLSKLKQILIYNKPSIKIKYEKILFLIYSFLLIIFKLLLKLKINSNYYKSKIILNFIELYYFKTKRYQKVKDINNNIIDFINSANIKFIKYNDLKKIISFFKNTNQISVAEKLLLNLIKFNEKNVDLKIELAEIYIMQSCVYKTELKDKNGKITDKNGQIDNELILKSKKLIVKAEDAKSKNPKILKILAEIDFIEGRINSSVLKYSNYLNYRRNEKLHKEELQFYPMLILSPPRTGATFAYQTLLNRFNKKLMPVGAGFYKFNTTLLNKNQIIEFASTNNSICHSHAGAEKINLNLIKLCLNKIIVNLRDPRQQLVSLTKNFINYYQEDKLTFYQFSDHRPAEYLKYSFEEKILFEINNSNGFFKNLVNYISSWIEIENNPDFPTKILFSLQENLKNDPKLYFNSILNFYEIEDKYFFKDDDKDYFKHNNFDQRHGPTEEWKTLPNEIINEMNKKIPEVFFTKFLWEK